MFKILIVEDDFQIRNELSQLLMRNNYDVVALEEFDKSIDKIKNENPHLILLDINIPYIDGYKLCSEIRSFSSVPIIFVTSRDSDLDELMSISIGGDDFITKPYNTSILIARISSLLKRAYSNDSISDIIEYKGVKINILSSELEYEGKKIELTKTELKIMNYLFVNKNKIVPRADIVEYLWDSEVFVDDNALSVNITRIRKKLEEIDIFDFIKTKRGQGYIL
ncbi:response regulator transcription factor [Oceanirhabdus seepicola]|uniref:Stage 0 sporulation protein A homolog n=1 Tax=Oceanirhabdus seepicola TaxID=2828781 RepID=A0A9J6P5H9_9CLOT|nr:response regulator transcription factor [Oceanirhabdus seepicola]MCM1991835.1 response regulator transcription factor [Oceanirhabdus seepicola]